MSFLQNFLQRFKKNAAATDTKPASPSTSPSSALPNFDPASQKNPTTNEYWQSIKDFGMAGLSVATGDPEAMKTLVDVLANATYQGLEHIDVKNDQKKQEIKLKLENAINQGADSLMKAFTKFQEAAQSSNKNMRAKYGRNRKVA